MELLPDDVLTPHEEPGSVHARAADIVDHVLFVVEDLDASRRLHTAALAPLGYVTCIQDDGVHYGAEDLDDFAIYRGSPITTASHVAFAAEGRTADDAPRRPGVP
jgi:hypothetical protein